MSNKSCETCLYAATHEQCDGCLGNPPAGQPFEYKHWTEGDGIARRRELEKTGQRNIVIGGAGEAEVNVNWTPDQTLTHLVMVAEACGYCVTKGRHWEYFCHELEIVTGEGHFRLTWWHNQFRSIERITTRTVWHRNL